MLLETLDLRTNDVLIYSQNMFNFNDSFKIIFKNSRIKTPKRISYFDVCNYIKDPAPKNLIIYRLLTNINNLDAYSTKYGYFITINNKVELIYFDPIFAIKDLRHLRFDFDPNRFRFKIQQVGLTSLTKKDEEPNFAEVYSFDLRAIEAQNQNDKIYADAIFAFDPNFVEEDQSISEIQNQYLDGEKKSENRRIIEEKGIVKTDLVQPKPADPNKVYDVREEIIDLLKQALNIPNSDNTVRRFTKEYKVDENNEDFSIPNQNLFDLFKSTNKSNELSQREKESVILKFD